CQRAVEVFHADRDVAVAGAEVVRAAVVVEGQLQDRSVIAEREEVVRRLELAVADDVHVALEAEAERLVERAALLGVGDPHHRVQELGHGRILELRRPYGRAIGLTRNQPLVRIAASGFYAWRWTMSWSLKGSYVETCSCDLICPCNATFDHGATYDYCRVALAFNI